MASEEAEDMGLALSDIECSVSNPSLLHFSPAPRFTVAAFAMLEAAIVDVDKGRVDAKQKENRECLWCGYSLSLVSVCARCKFKSLYLRIVFVSTIPTHIQG